MEVNSTGGQGSRKAVAPSDDDEDDDDDDDDDDTIRGHKMGKSQAPYLTLRFYEETEIGNRNNGNCSKELLRLA